MGGVMVWRGGLVTPGQLLWVMNLWQVGKYRGGEKLYTVLSLSIFLCRERGEVPLYLSLYNRWCFKAPMMPNKCLCLFSVFTFYIKNWLFWQLWYSTPTIRDAHKRTWVTDCLGWWVPSHSHMQFWATAIVVAPLCCIQLCSLSSCPCRCCII